MSITILCASQRRSSLSAKVAAHVQLLLARDFDVCNVAVLDLGRTPVPWWSETWTTNGSPAWRQWAPTAECLRRTDGFVIVTPEWGGMAPPALKNLFLLCDDTDELADKPAMLVAVSSGSGGAHVVAELRSSSYKNTRICYIPEQVLVQNVGDVFLGGSLADSPFTRDLEDRLRHAVGLLLRYAEALVSVRHSGARDRDRFRYGM